MLSIKKPDGIHNWGITYESNDSNKIRKFVDACYSHLSKDLSYFHQSGLMFNGELDDYQYFEFWGVNSNDAKSIDLMIDNCIKVGEAIGENLKY